MTIEIMPAADSPWRAYPVPKDVDLANGPWCPMDIRIGLLPEQHGWVCASCGAYWDLRGRHGRWLSAGPARLVDGHLVEHHAPAGRPHRVARVVAVVFAAGVVIGGGYAAGRQLRGTDVPEDLLWTVSLLAVGVLLAGAVLVLAWNWWQGLGAGGGGAR